MSNPRAVEMLTLRAGWSRAFASGSVGPIRPGAATERTPWTLRPRPGSRWCRSRSISGRKSAASICATTSTAKPSRRFDKAWLDHLVLVFRGQQFGQEELVRATGYFGEIGPLSRPPKYFPKGYAKLLPNIMMISNIRENGETIGALPDGEMNFHHDMIHSELPHNGTLLYSVEIPSLRRRHAVRQRLCRLRHARSGDPRPSRRPQGAQPLQLRHHHPGRHQQSRGGLRRSRSPGVPHP